ncbi:hypothetical protein Bbelb_174390 [Branchiostoma belcheri]|nr:hypothetical protein Bbelb_174390 [Branchiostoma belcheri]
MAAVVTVRQSMCGGWSGRRHSGRLSVGKTARRISGLDFNPLLPQRCVPPKLLCCTPKGGYTGYAEAEAVTTEPLSGRQHKLRVYIVVMMEHSSVHATSTGLSMKVIHQLV